MLAAMTLFQRYVGREVLLAVGGVTGVLLAILLTNQLVAVLRRAAEGQIPTSVVLELLWLGATRNVTVILPIGLLLGVIIALGRLYHESEMTAARACGIGDRAMFVPVLALGAVLAALSGWLANAAAPHAAQRAFDIRAEADRTAAVRGLAPGRFRNLGGNTTLYFEASADDGTLRDVFIRQLDPTTGRMAVTTAESATYRPTADGLTWVVTLQNGRRRDGVPGEGQWRTLEFTEQRIPVTLSVAPSAQQRVDALSTLELAGSGEPREVAEFHWRLATPIMVLLLAVLSVPLSRLAPRQGRYGRVPWALLVYFVYVNLLTAGQTWLERGMIPAWSGLWWAHGLAAALCVTLLWRPLRSALRAARSSPGTA
jgi:lipopolysaccharide export system permease protein